MFLTQTSKTLLNTWPTEDASWTHTHTRARARQNNREMELLSRGYKQAVQAGYGFPLFTIFLPLKLPFRKILS